MYLIWDAFVTKLKILERVLARRIVEKSIGSHDFARLVMSTLAFDFPECIFWVSLTRFVCDKSNRSLGTKCVFFTSPESTVHFDGFVLFALEPSLLAFADVGAVLQKKNSYVILKLGHMCGNHLDVDRNGAPH